MVNEAEPLENNITYESTPEQLLKLHPVVAIGASAGGLQALRDLLEYLPPNLGMTYVIIQHLSPTHDSILPELLSAKTNMPVHLVEHGMKIEKDNIYVIPPNTFMSIVDSKLALVKRIKTDGVHHAVNYFLNALAPVYQTKAVAVILSGSGTDGTVGVHVIKEHGGVTFAQDETATFSGMPKTASDSGYTDFVLPCKRIAEELTAIAKNPQGILTMNEVVKANESELKKIQILLHNKKGVDFGFYKKTTVNRRIMRRMALNKCKNLTEYTKYLRENTNEINLLYKDLLINVTSFFRDAAVYKALTEKIFPALFKDRKDNETLRIWTPACANGEEAFSIAICLFDYLQEKAISTPIQIFGTDLSEPAIEMARAGRYHKSVMENVSADRLKRYFTKTDGHYQIIKPIRDICVFATHNLLKDPPFSRMDVISCQNVMIYLESNPQKKILQAFHYSLKSSGYLLLGKSETIGNSTELYSQLDKELKIYSKKQTPSGLNSFNFSLHPPFTKNLTANEKIANQTSGDIDIEKETDRLLLARYVPASVVVNKDLQIVRFNGATSNYLQPSSGRASLHLLKMVKEELVLEIKGLINRAKKEGAAVKKDGIHFSQNDTAREISIEVVPVRSSLNDFYYLVLFKEGVALPAPAETGNGQRNGLKDSKNERLIKLEQQLVEAREYMKTMSEEFEATREELQSSNEEVLSSNEELQSINEELETSQEELQSTNEELRTINEELLQRTNDLRQMSEFSQAIIETINEPLLVLGNDMRVRKANKAFYTFFKTNIDRTEGYHFFEIDNGQWNFPGLKTKIKELIEKGISFDNWELTANFSFSGEKILWFNAMRMTQNDSKDNTILLVIQDITERAKGTRDLKRREEHFRLLLQNAFDIMTIYSKEGDIIYQSEALERSLGYPAMDTLNKNIFSLGIVHPDDLPLKYELFNESLKNPGKKVKGQIRLQHKNSEYKTMDVIFRNMLDNDSIKGIIANYQDVTNMIIK